MAEIPKLAIGRLNTSLRLQTSENSEEPASLNILIKEVNYLPLNQKTHGYGLIFPNKYYVEAEIAPMGEIIVLK